MATTNDGWPQFIKTCDDWRERKAKEDGDKGYSGGGMEVLTGLGDCDDLLAAAPRVRANDGRGVTLLHANGIPCAVSSLRELAAAGELRKASCARRRSGSCTPWCGSAILVR